MAWRRRSERVRNAIIATRNGEYYHQILACFSANTTDGCESSVSVLFSSFQTKLLINFSATSWFSAYC